MSFRKRKEGTCLPKLALSGFGFPVLASITAVPAGIPAGNYLTTKLHRKKNKKHTTTNTHRKAPHSHARMSDKCGEWVRLMSPGLQPHPFLSSVIHCCDTIRTAHNHNHSSHSHGNNLKLRFLLVLVLVLSTHLRVVYMYWYLVLSPPSQHSIFISSSVPLVLQEVVVVAVAAAMRCLRCVRTVVGLTRSTPSGSEGGSARGHHLRTYE